MNIIIIISITSIIICINFNFNLNLNIYISPNLIKDVNIVFGLEMAPLFQMLKSVDSTQVNWAIKVRVVCKWDLPRFKDKSQINFIKMVLTDREVIFFSLLCV